MRLATVLQETLPKMSPTVDLLQAIIDHLKDKATLIHLQ